jgi:hypothetical protein
MHAANRALSYCVGKPHMSITYYACDMCLIVFIDASYLSRSEARSVVARHQRHHFRHFINHSMSAAEAEYAALFTGAPTWAIPSFLPATILCDNTTAIGLANDSIKQNRSKAIDMRFHWVRDRIRQKQFCIAYIPTTENLADYTTKNLQKTPMIASYSYYTYELR